MKSQLDTNSKYIPVNIYYTLIAHLFGFVLLAIIYIKSAIAITKFVNFWWSRNGFALATNCELRRFVYNFAVFDEVAAVECQNKPMKTALSPYISHTQVFTSHTQTHTKTYCPNRHNIISNFSREKTSVFGGWCGKNIELLRGIIVQIMYTL